MEPDNENRLSEIEKKLDAIYISSEKTRKYFKIIFWITIIAFVLPMIAMIFIVPSVATTYTESYSDLLQ